MEYDEERKNRMKSFLEKQNSGKGLVNRTFSQNQEINNKELNNEQKKSQISQEQGIKNNSDKIFSFSTNLSNDTKTNLEYKQPEVLTRNSENCKFIN